MTHGASKPQEPTKAKQQPSSINLPEYVVPLNSQNARLPPPPPPPSLYVESSPVLEEARGTMDAMSGCPILRRPRHWQIQGAASNAGRLVLSRHTLNRCLQIAKRKGSKPHVATCRHMSSHVTTCRHVFPLPWASMRRLGCQHVSTEIPTHIQRVRLVHCVTRLRVLRL